MKEGLYMGQETSEEDGRAMHGINHFLPNDPLTNLVPPYMAREKDHLNRLRFLM